MSVDVLLFTGMTGYSSNINDFGDDPVYETRTRSSGTYRIATYLRKEFEFDVEVIDFIFSWTLEELKEVCKSRIGPDTRMVGIGGIFYLHAPVIVKLFAHIKEEYPHVLTTAGSQTIWSITQIPNIDYYISGYGELGLKAVLNGTAKYEMWQDRVKHVDCWRTPEYAAYPWPILTILYEDRDYVLPHETLSMETSRGCKFKCSYCNYPVLGVKGDYTRSAADFEYNMKDNYDRWGITEYIITDDTFNDHIEKIRKYGDVVESLDFTPNFGGYIRADLMTQRPHDVEELARMRFNSHMYGIESTNHASAKSIGKGAKATNILPAILEAKKYIQKNNGFYRGEMSFIYGLPHETQETLDYTFKWIDENWQNESVSMFPLMIMRDTGLIHPNEMTHNLDKYGYTVMQQIEAQPIGNRLDHIYDNPNIHQYFKDRIRKQLPDPMGPEFQYATYLWRNEFTNYMEAFIKVQESLWGHERYWDRAVPIFGQANWNNVGFTKTDMQKSFRDLPSMMNPPEEMVRASIEDYKKKKLSL